MRTLIDNGFQAFNAGRLSEACHIFADKMLAPKNDTTIGLTVAGAMTPAGLGGCVIEMMERGLVDFVISTGANLYHDLHYALNFTLHRGSPFLDDRVLYENGVIRIYDVLFPGDGAARNRRVHPRVPAALRHERPGLDVRVPLSARAGPDRSSGPAARPTRSSRAPRSSACRIYTSSPGDSSIGMNVAWHELMNGSKLMIDPNLDVNEVCAIILAGKKNGCVILGGGSPKNFYLQGQPTLWEVYGIPKGGNEFFIQITTDQVVWGGLSGATPSEAVSWGKVNPGVLPDTVVAYCDSTIAFPLFCEYAVGSEHGTRPRKAAVPPARGARRRSRKRRGKAAQRKRREEAAVDRPGFAGNASSELRADRRRTVRRAARVRRRERARRRCRLMRQTLHWDVLFVLEDGRRCGARPTPLTSAGRWTSGAR